jgi:hypothetical protein
VVTTEKLSFRVRGGAEEALISGRVVKLEDGRGYAEEFERGNIFIGKMI